MIGSRCLLNVSRKFISGQFLRSPVCQWYRYRTLQNSANQFKSPKCQPKIRFPSRCLYKIKRNYTTLQTEDIPVTTTKNTKYGCIALRSLPEYKETFFDESTSLTSDVIKGFHKHILDFIEISTGQDPPFITDSSLDNVISNLLTSLENFSDAELFAILFYMAKFPGIRDIKDPKYMDIWKKLDKECFRRLRHLDRNTMLQVSDLFFNLKLNRRSLFHWNVVKKLMRKSDFLPKIDFVRMMLCISCSSQMHPNINLYPLEFNMQRLIDIMSAEEIAVVADAFNRVPYFIKDKNLVATILDIVAKDPKSISSEGLIQLSKLVRNSSHFIIAPAVYSFQEAMLTEVDRLSSRAAVYLGLIGARVLHPNEDLIQRIISKMINDFSHLSLHDISKLCEIIGTFETNCDDLCHKIVEDLRTTKQSELELSNEAHHLPTIVNFLCMKGFIFEDFITKVLSTEFLTLCYGNVMYRFKMEVLYCDLTAAIELKNYQGPRLTEKQRGYLLKVHMFWLNWLPLPPKKVEPEYKRFIRSFFNIAEGFLGGAQFLHVTNILPQFEFADAVFCTDSMGNIIEMPKSYSTANEEHGIKLIPNNIELKDINIHAVMLVSRSGCMYNSHKLSGRVKMQRRQTEQLGYITHQVYASDWIKMTDDSQRNQFLVDFFNFCRHVNHPDRKTSSVNEK